MQYQGKSCVIEAWDASQAEVKVSFDVTFITTKFQETLASQLTQKGLVVRPASPESEILVRGRYVRIDQGNRLLRYLLTFFAGKAVMRVEGELVIKGESKAGLIATANRSWGLFGGSSDDLLKKCAESCAKTIARQVISVLKKS